jgi:hypothetical protein
MTLTRLVNARFNLSDLMQVIHYADSIDSNQPKIPLCGPLRRSAVSAVSFGFSSCFLSVSESPW